MALERNDVHSLFWVVAEEHMPFICEAAEEPFPFLWNQRYSVAVNRPLSGSSFVDPETTAPFASEASSRTQGEAVGVADARSNVLADQA